MAYRFAARPPVPSSPSPVPVAQEPDQVTVKWQDPVRSDGLTVPVKTHRLIFRPHATLPLGSYGLDAATSQTRRGSLPTSNARPLPTDLKIDLSVEGSREANFASLTVDQLTSAGVFPKCAWRPESWSVLFQTISANGVPSALAPVKVLLTFTGTQGKTEERQPGDLVSSPTHRLATTAAGGSAGHHGARPLPAAHRLPLRWQAERCRTPAASRRDPHDPLPLEPGA